MDLEVKLYSHYSEISELTKEINSLLEKLSMRMCGELSARDVEHVSKIAFDVTCEIGPILNE